VRAAVAAGLVIVAGCTGGGSSDATAPRVGWVDDALVAVEE
jgi:hypothetical protein